MSQASTEIEVQMASVKKDIEYIRKSVDDINANMKSDRVLLVSKTEHDSAMATLKEDISEVRDNQTKVVWVVITSFLVALANLVLKIK